MSRSEIATGYAWSIIIDRSIISGSGLSILEVFGTIETYFYFSVHENTAPYPCQSPSGGQLVASVSCQARPPPASAKMYQPVPWTENPPYFIVNPFLESLVFWWYETNPPSFVGSPDESFHDISKWNSNWSFSNNLFEIYGLSCLYSIRMFQNMSVHCLLSKIRSIFQDCCSFPAQFLKINLTHWDPIWSEHNTSTYFWPFFESQHNRVNSYNVGELCHNNHQANNKDHCVVVVSSNLSEFKFSGLLEKLDVNQPQRPK